MAEILPRGKGIDICGMTSYQYVIRSDIGYYMRAYHLRDEEKGLQIFPIHPSCSKGDHYFATTEGYMYIICGNECRRLDHGPEALMNDSNPEVFTINPDCLGGSFYLAQREGLFYIVYAHGVYLEVNDLRYSKYNSKYTKKRRLADECRGGLYYFATEGFFYVLKQVHPKWGLQYHRTRDLSTNSEPRTFSVCRAVCGFVPGGLAFLKGAVCARWEFVCATDSYIDDVKEEYMQVHKVGYRKQICSEIEHSWKVKFGGAGEHEHSLITMLLKAELSLEYGGCLKQTKSEDWSEEVTFTKKLAYSVPYGKSVYVWQLVFGLGSEDILFSRRTAVTETPKPPPLP